MFWWLWSTKKKLAVLGAVLAVAATVVVVFALPGSPDGSPSVAPADGSVPGQPVTTPPVDGSAPPATISDELASSLDVKPTLTSDPSRTASNVLPRAFAPVLSGTAFDVVPDDEDDYAVYVVVENYPDLKALVDVQTSYLGFFGDAESTEVSPTKSVIEASGEDQGVSFTATLTVESFPGGIVVSGMVQIDGDPKPLSAEELADLADTQWWNVWNAVASRLGISAGVILEPEEPGVTVP